MYFYYLLRYVFNNIVFNNVFNILTYIVLIIKWLECQFKTIDNAI